MCVKAVRTSGWVSGLLLFGVLTAGAWRIHSGRTPAAPTIAFIPQTAGPMLWEVEHLGATQAVQKLRCHLYWNTPTSEADVAGQVKLIERVARGNYQGLVVAPNHRLSILSPLRRALAAGLPVVVVAEPLDLPAGPKLGYIVNDDEKMGELAAAEIARLLHGKGNVAVVGLTATAPGVTLRLRGAERLLARRFPDVRVVSRSGGAYNTALAEELTRGAVDSRPGLDAVLGLTASSTRGVHAALNSRLPGKPIVIVGCEQDTDLIGYVGSGEIAAVTAENTYRMGYEAVELITASLQGKPLPARSVIPPFLITKQNLYSPETVVYTSLPR
jgi:ribose transport system substrate-binding protein